MPVLSADAAMVPPEVLRPPVSRRPGGWIPLRLAGHSNVARSGVAQPFFSPRAAWGVPDGVRRPRRRRFTPCTGSGGRAGAQQVVLGHGGEAERLVADLVEEDDEPVVLDAHDDAVPPLRVLDRRLDGERGVGPRLRGGGALLGGAGAGVAVAVAAGLVELLAEVAEQELPPALGGLGVSAHHLHAALVDPLVVLGQLPRGSGRHARRRGVVGRVRRAVLVQDDGRDLLEQVQVAGQWRGRAAGLLAEVLHVDALLDARGRGGRHQAGDLLELLLGRGAGGEEATDPEVLLAVHQDGEGRSPSRPARPISW